MRHINTLCNESEILNMSQPNAICSTGGIKNLYVVNIRLGMCKLSLSI